MSKEFRDNVKSFNSEELDSAWKCFSLAYLGMYESQWDYSAATLLKMTAELHMKRELELMGEEHAY
jgi:uncharacterized membrane protein YfhO